MSIDPDQHRRVLAMRARRVPWSEIARRLGQTWHQVRADHDPNYRKQRNAKDARRRRAAMADAGCVPVGVTRKSPQEHRRIEAAAAALANDTRDLTARLMGDPLPGRSALDKIQWAIPVIRGFIPTNNNSCGEPPNIGKKTVEPSTREGARP